MEYPSLGSLDSLVKIGLRCDEAQLREIASFCLLGLEFLHSRGTGHYVMVVVLDDMLECRTHKCVSHREGIRQIGLLWL